MLSDWFSLCTNSPGHVEWLCQYEFGKDKYTVTVTNLCNLWTERLDRTDIIKRASEVSSDISPQEDQSQMDILLSKIKETLRGDDAAFVEMRPAKASNQAEFELYMAIPLPGGLNDLHWSLYFRREPPDAMREKLIAPLMGINCNLKAREELLVATLHDKDVVMGRMLDKIEAIGLDFGTVFPNARFPKRGNQREQAVKHIKGLAAFDVASFRSKSLAEASHGLDAADILLKALKGTGSIDTDHLLKILDPKNRSEQGNVGELGRITREVQLGTQSEAKLKQHSRENAEDGFQKQSTPEGPKHQTGNFNASPTLSHDSVVGSPGALQPVVFDDDTTEDEEDLDVAYSSYAKPSTKFQQPVEAKSIPEAEPVIGDHDKVGLAVAVETENNENNASAAKENDQATPNLPVKRKFGKLGGRPHEHAVEKQEPARSPEKAAPPQSVETGNKSPQASQPLVKEKDDIPATSKPAPRRKLGKIGAIRRVEEDIAPVSRIHEESVTEKPDENTRVPRRMKSSEFLPSQLPVAAPQQAETAEDKANRKREMLKRDLEEARPVVKKKRRF